MGISRDAPNTCDVAREVVTGQEQRAHPRYENGGMASLLLGGRVGTATVRNISLGGALLEPRAALTVAAATSDIMVSIQTETDEVFSVDARIVRQQLGGQIAVQWSESPPGLMRYILWRASQNSHRRD